MVAQELGECRPCPFCAEPIKVAAVVCRYCSRELAPATDRLEPELSAYLARGYRVVWREGDRAQLVRPKRFSLGWALLWFCFLGVGLIAYLLYYLSKQDDVVMLEPPSPTREADRLAALHTERATLRRRLVYFTAATVVAAVAVLVLPDTLAGVRGLMLAAVTIAGLSCLAMAAQLVIATHKLS